MKTSKNLFLSVISAALCAAIMLLLGSCGEQAEDKLTKLATELSTANKSATAAPTTVSQYVQNPLTGLDMASSAENQRPVAVMINNIQIAQDVQTSVGDADIVYEMLVEGGITRLMAVYSDISKIGQIGSVRSSRYTYAELAAALDARYVHCGSDNKYCTPFMRTLGLDDIDLGSNGSAAAQRISNGHDYEHTLYTFGDKLSSLCKKGRTEIKSHALGIYSFNSKSSPKTYSDECTAISVKFSDYYRTLFKYDKSAKKYIRCDKYGDEMLDYKTDKNEKFSNIFVLFTNVYALSDGEHMRSQLDEGEGYLATNGSYTKIKWKKGDASEPLKFYNIDGSELKLNCGNSYVCITGKENKSACTFK